MGLTSKEPQKPKYRYIVCKPQSMGGCWIVAAYKHRADAVHHVNTLSNSNHYCVHSVRYYTK